MIDTQTLKIWFVNGPTGDEGIFLHGVAMMMWWRMLSMMCVVTAAVCLGLLLDILFPDKPTAWAGVWVGLMFGPWVEKLGPKYTLIKNY